MSKKATKSNTSTTKANNTEETMTDNTDNTDNSRASQRIASRRLERDNTETQPEFNHLDHCVARAFGIVKSDRGPVEYMYCHQTGQYIHNVLLREQTVTRVENGKKTIHVMLNPTDTVVPLGRASTKARASFFTDGPHKGQVFWCITTSGTGGKDSTGRARTWDTQCSAMSSETALTMYKDTRALYEAACAEAGVDAYPTTEPKARNFTCGKGGATGGYFAHQFGTAEWNPLHSTGRTSQVAKATKRAEEAEAQVAALTVQAAESADRLAKLEAMVLAMQQAKSA